MSIEKKVNTKFSAKDAITKRFGIMAKASARFGRTAFGAFKRVNSQATKFKGITSGFLKAQVIGKGFGLLTRGVGSVVDQFIQFDKAALGATVRFKDVSSGASNFNDVLEATRKTAREMGAQTEFTAAQNAEALNFLAKAGWESAAAFGGLRSMVDLATATGEDFERVADISSDLLGAFGLAADNTADKIKNLNRVNDILVKTSNSANVTVENMFDTMKQVGPVAGILSASIEEVATLTGVLGNAGIKGGDAMTALKNAYLRLAAPVGRGAAVLKKLKITLDDGTGGAKSMTALMGELGEKMKDLGDVERAKFMEAIFGKFAIAGGVTLQKNIKNIKEFRKQVDAAGSTSRKTAEIMRTSIEAKLLSLGSAATEVGFKVLSAFEVDGKNGIDALTEAIRNADIQPFIETLKVMASTVATIATGFFEMGAGLGIIAGKIAEISESRLGGISSDVFKRAEQTGLFKPGVAERFASAFGGTPAPNAAEATAKAQTSKFTGQLNIAGAPEGSTVETSQGVPGFDLSLQGAN